MKKFTVFVSLLTIFLNFHFFAFPAQANLFDSICQAGLCDVGKNAYQYNNPESPKSLGDIVASAIKAALGSLGIIFLALIVYSGFLWMTAAGNSDTIGTAKGLIINSVIGLIIVLTAYSVTLFVFEKLILATQQDEAIYEATF